MFKEGGNPIKSESDNIIKFPPAEGSIAGKSHRFEKDWAIQESKRAREKQTGNLSEEEKRSVKRIYDLFNNPEVNPKTSSAEPEIIAKALLEIKNESEKELIAEVLLRNFESEDELIAKALLKIKNESEEENGDRDNVLENEFWDRDITLAPRQREDYVKFMFDIIRKDKEAINEVLKLDEEKWKEFYFRVMGILRIYGKLLITLNKYRELSENKSAHKLPEEIIVNEQ